MNLTIKVDTLKKQLRGAKNEHIKKYEIALEEWAKRCLSLTEEWQKKLKDNPKLFAESRCWGRSLPSAPESHQKDYEKAIKILDFECKNTIVLSEKDYKQYLLDEWEWTRSFNNSILEYS